MARKGRPRTPDAILQLRGSSMVSRKTGRRYDGSGVDAPAGDSSPPRGLAGESLATWKELVAELVNLGLFAQTDRRVLERYCQAWAIWCETIGDAEMGMRARLDLSAELRRLEGDLGLSPASRQRLRADMMKPKDESKAKKFFGA